MNCGTRPIDFVKKIVYDLIIPSNKNLKTFKKTPVRFVKGRATFFTWGLLIMSNSTTFLRVEKTKNYTVILNSLITSTDLSPEEKVILFHILSLPDDWVIYKDYFKKYYRGCISDSKIDKVWKGLKAKGFLTSTRVKSENGTFSSWKYEVREVPFTDIPESDMSENQTIGNTTSQEKGDIQSTNLPSTNLQSTNSTNFNNTSIILGKNEIEINNAQKEEDIVISKDAIKSEDTFEIKVPVESGKVDKEFEVLEKFKELVKIDTRFLDENDDIQYVKLCKILAKDTGWDGFFQIVLKSSLNELPELIKIHKTSLDDYSIKEIRKHHIFYLNKLIK